MRWTLCYCQVHLKGACFLCANLTPLNDPVSELVTSNLVTQQTKPASKEANIQITMFLLSDPLKRFISNINTEPQYEISNYGHHQHHHGQDSSSSPRV